jgi:tetratricopeptide (TPR) repeat protein
VEAAPDNHRLRYAYAELLVGAGQADRAKAELEKLKSVDELFGAVANLFGRLGEFDACVAVLDTAIQKQPTPDLHVRRGACKHGAKNDAGARADYEAAVALDPKFAAGYYYLGMHLRDAGKKKEALAQLEKAASLAGDTSLGKRAQKAAQELKRK